MRDDAQWLVRVVENLLSITRMGEDTRITKQPEAAEEVLGEVARKFRKHYPDVKISVAVPDELLIVPMDAILIEQVMTNLLENAVRHGKNTTHIALSVHQEGENAVFAVQDNGGGIPPKLLPVLFSGTLRHSDTPTGDGKRNMGLGLSVCNAIVRAHGGTMHAQNRDGGAEFIFCLPMIERSRNCNEHSRKNTHRGGSAKSIAHFISTILNSNDYETLLARSGSEAQTMISSHCPDLVILDLRSAGHGRH